MVRRRSHDDRQLHDAEHVKELTGRGTAHIMAMRLRMFSSHTDGHAFRVFASGLKVAQ
jgi:hypothetical protein